jgi:hypothetical protein
MEHAIYFSREDYSLKNGCDTTSNSCGNKKYKTCNTNRIRHVGYYKQETDAIKQYYSQENIDYLSTKISDLLEGVDPKSRRIIIPDNVICNVMSQVEEMYTPHIGDIFTRYNIPTQDLSSNSTISNYNSRVIEIIVSDVRTSTAIEENNKKLTIWSSLYGDFNKQGLRQHAPIKLQQKRPTPFQFHMRY